MTGPLTLNEAFLLIAIVVLLALTAFRLDRREQQVVAIFLFILAILWLGLRR